MTTIDLAALVAQYRAGLEAELVLLGRLEQVAERQRLTSESNDLVALQRASDEREQLMSSLVGIEQELAGVRTTLGNLRHEASQVAGFDETVELHREAKELVARILQTDGEAIRTLARAEFARRETVRTLEQGESTLAAYRRALTPLPSANLINRRG